MALLAFEAYRARGSVDCAVRAGLDQAPDRSAVSATLVFLGGIVLLLSGNLPALEDRIGFLSDILPLPFAEASHLLASIVGLLLIVLARGLYRRIALARVASIALLIAGACFSLLKGWIGKRPRSLRRRGGLLLANPRAFYRKGDWRSFRPTPTWLALWSSCWRSSRWSASSPIAMSTTHPICGGNSPGTAMRRAFCGQRWRWSSGGGHRMDALINRPAHSSASAEVAIPAAVSADLATLARTRSPRRAARRQVVHGLVRREGIPDVRRVRPQLDHHGRPGRRAPFSRALIWQFAEAADHAGARAVFYAMHARVLLATYLDLGLAILKIGEVARVDLQQILACRTGARSRCAMRTSRATREGLEFSVIPKSDVPPP